MNMVFICSYLHKFHLYYLKKFVTQQSYRELDPERLNKKYHNDNTIPLNIMAESSQQLYLIDLKIMAITTYSRIIMCFL